jgi:uncharacterized protein YecE (DUF72 family)
MARLYLGTSGWAYGAWKPDFYPAKLPAKKFLEYYATRLTGVEVNYSFRRMLSEKTQQAWIASTPPDFLFAVKAHQTITHFRRLKDVGQPLSSFLQSLQPLAEAARLGPILFQLPPNLKADPALLRDFLHHLPTTRQLRCCLEFRHESWFVEEVYGQLRDANVALCRAESERIIAPEINTADFNYYRFRQPEYASSQRSAIAARLQAAQAVGKDVFAFFKHEENPQSALNALEVLQRLAPMAA